MATGIIESMLELRPEYGRELCSETGFLKWSLKRISSSDFKLTTKLIDDNKLYLSEVLPLLLTDERN